MLGASARALLIVAPLLWCGPAIAAGQSSAAQMMDDLMYGRGSVGGPFTLTDQTGKQRSDTASGDASRSFILPASNP